MRAVAATASVLAALSLATGCASRRPAPRVAAMVKVKPAEPALRTAAETKAGLEKAKKRTAYLPMLSDADAHKALPMWPKMMPVPNLARVGGLAPKSMQATLQSMMSERREGALDSALLGDVFWVVSNANDCFYWMGHAAFQSAVAGVSETHVFETENPERLDARRKVVFPFARKLTREPSKVTREDIDALRKELKDKEIVDLVFAICRFNTMNRLADAFGVPLEEENVFAPPPKSKPTDKPKPSKEKPGEKAM